MTQNSEKHVLTDAQWSELTPLIEACRPPCKTEPIDLRRTIEAIIWRHDNGAKWRQIPAEFGPWWRPAQTFIRWSRLGVWNRLLEQAQEERCVQMGMTFLDGTSIRAHHKAAGAVRQGASSAERDEREALGRSRGGYGTKACVIADGAGRALGFMLAPGQAHELPLATLATRPADVHPALDHRRSRLCRTPVSRSDLPDRRTSGDPGQIQRGAG